MCCQGAGRGGQTKISDISICKKYLFKNLKKIKKKYNLKKKKKKNSLFKKNTALSFYRRYLKQHFHDESYRFS